MVQTNSSVKYGIDPYRQIHRPRLVLDRFAEQALEKTRNDLLIEPKDSYNQENGRIQTHYEKALEKLKREIQSKNFSENDIHTLSHKLDQAGLDDIERLLLSTPDIYAFILNNSLAEINFLNNSSKDLTAIYNAVRRKAHDRYRTWFLARLLEGIFNARRIVVDNLSSEWKQLHDLALSRSIPIRQGQVESAVMDLLSSIYRDGGLADYVETYIKNQTVIPQTAFTSSIKRGMIDYLASKIEIPKGTPATEITKYDQHFALAYYEALKLSTVKDDPIDQIRTKGKVSWDFTVEAFEDADLTKGVTAENIKAAGALDYVYTVGELMRVFDVANALVLRWGGGILDVPEGKTASDLYRFYKLRHERSTYEERAMLYKRVLNNGDGKLLSNMVANTAFPILWHKLLKEVAEYIQKLEGGKREDTFVSRAQIYQAIKNLQYNLTEAMTGMSHIQVTEDYAHLQEAMAILRTDEILNTYGGRRKTMWSVIEQIAKEDLGVMVPTAPLRTLAVEGNKIFQWIAEFNEGVVREDEFRGFLSSAEAWIIAQASIDAGGQDPQLNGHRKPARDVFSSDDQADYDMDDEFDTW